MKPTQCLFAHIALLLLCLSCSRSENSSLRIGDSEESIELSALFREAKITHLVEDSTALTGEVSKLKCSDSLFYCLNNTHEQLAAFDAAGNQCWTLRKVGNSREEYLRITDFDVEEGVVYLLCYPTKLIRLDRSRAVCSVTLFDESFSSIAVHEGQVYLYADHQRALYRLDDHNQPERLFAEELLPAAPNPQVSAFHKVGGQLFYSSHASPTLHQINGSTVTPILEFDYENKSNCLARYAQPELLQPLERLQYSSPALRTLVELNDSYLVIYTHQLMVRAALLDKDKSRILRDGILIGTPSPEWQDQGGIFATGVEMTLLPLNIRGLMPIVAGSSPAPTVSNGYAISLVTYIE